MLELGPEGEALHAALGEASSAMRSIWYSAPVPLMNRLWDALPFRSGRAVCRDLGCARGEVLRAIAGGEAVMIKVRSARAWDRSSGAQRPLRARHRTGSRLKRCFNWLADFSSTISVFNVFRYLTVRTGGAMFHRDAVRVPVRTLGQSITCACARARGSRSEDGPQSHLIASAVRRPWAG